jgi:hypothetical protein
MKEKFQTVPNPNLSNWRSIEPRDASLSTILIATSTSFDGRGSETCVMGRKWCGTSTIAGRVTLGIVAVLELFFFLRYVIVVVHPSAVLELEYDASHRSARTTT